jgi:hypothetical protein
MEVILERRLNTPIIDAQVQMSTFSTPVPIRLLTGRRKMPTYPGGMVLESVDLIGGKLRDVMSKID